MESRKIVSEGTLVKSWWFTPTLICNSEDSVTKFAYWTNVLGYYGPTLEGITRKEWKRRNKRV